MDQPNSTSQFERSISRYVMAMDAGNLDEIAEILKLAETDTALDRIIAEINMAYADELGLSLVAVDGEVVRSLIQKHFSSAQVETGPLPQITVGEVTARMIAERAIPQTDQANSRKLLAMNIPVPDWLSLSEIRKLSQQVKFTFSDRFWKVFRDMAIQMNMGRGQAQLAATRRSNPRCAPRDDAHTNEGNHDAK